MTSQPLPSWRSGPARDALLSFLDRATELPLVERVAYFDNDGTLWCERPTYVQFDFFVHGLRRRVAEDPALADRTEFAAVLAGDNARISELGLARIAHALAGLYAGLRPEQYTEQVREFMAGATHSALGRPLRTTTYQPMLELLAALRSLDFTVGVVTGGGADFVRAISADLYEVPPELVVGTLVRYQLEVDGRGAPRLIRTGELLGDANEGGAKVTNIQSQIGRRPLLAAGNSAGDRQLLEWATAGHRPGLALLVDHDDSEREFAYAGEAVTFQDSESITEVGDRLGWTVVSMARDWETVFPPQ